MDLRTKYIRSQSRPLHIYRLQRRWAEEKRIDLFIDMNLAGARDMTYISPDAWRKYLLDAETCI